MFQKLVPMNALSVITSFKVYPVVLGVGGGKREGRGSSGRTGGEETSVMEGKGGNMCVCVCTHHSVYENELAVILNWGMQCSCRCSVECEVQFLMFLHKCLVRQRAMQHGSRLFGPTLPC